MRRCDHPRDEFDAEFDALLRASMEAYASKQSRFENELNSYSMYHYDLKTGTLIFRRMYFFSRRYSMTPTGTYLPSTQNWCWAWFNDTFSDSIRAEATQWKQKLWEATQYKVFNTPHFDVQLPEVDELCALTLHIAKGHAVFKLQECEPYLYLRVHPR